MDMKIFAALLMMTLSAAAAAQINKCVDKTGKVVGYGNECPEGLKSEQSAVKSLPSAAPAPASATAQKSLAERDADFRKRQIEKQEAAAKAEKKVAETDQRR